VPVVLSNNIISKTKNQKRKIKGLFSIGQHEVSFSAARPLLADLPWFLDFFSMLIDEEQMKGF
jgi:hypothetical protein